MGYEGHLMGVEDRAKRAGATGDAMALLARAHADVGGEVISAGGTGTYDTNRVATEIQAGSYALMDTAYAKLGLPFRQALFLLGSVISVSGAFAVADVGLKALGMDHGNPSIDGAKVWFCSDEHVTFAGDARAAGGRAHARLARARRSHRGVPRADPPRARRRGGGRAAGGPAGLVQQARPGARSVRADRVHEHEARGPREQVVDRERTTGSGSRRASSARPAPR